MAKRKDMGMSYAEFMQIPELLPLESDGHNLKYLFTRDPALLQDFIDTRERIFAEKPVTEKSLAENEGWNYGLDSHVLTILDGNKCVGGAVVVINHCDGTPGKLPVEKGGLCLKHTFPELNLSKESHASFKSLFIDHDYADWSCSANLFRSIYNLCAFYRVSYLFAMAPMATARRNRIGAKRIGVDMEIIDSVNLPQEERWNGFERHLLFVDLIKEYAKREV